MSTLSKQQKEGMTEDEQREYCDWCFRKDYGNCKKCALNAITMPCDECGQKYSEGGRGGEYPCPLCGIPTAHDDVAESESPK